MTKGKLIAVIIGVIITVGGIVGVVLMLTLGAKEPEYTVENGVLSISGMYSEEITLTGATVELKDTPLEITKRVNGYASKGVLKGQFQVTGINENVYINFYDANAPYISIISEGKYYFINCPEEAKTTELFNKIKGN